jgi:hypothetical protein
MIKRKEFSKKLSQQNCCVIRATDWRGWGKSRELQSRKPVFWPRFQARTSKESITAALTWQVTVIHYCECQMRMYRMWNICLTESPTSVKLRLQNERSPYVCVCVCVCLEVPGTFQNFQKSAWNLKFSLQWTFLLWHYGLWHHIAW